MSEQVLTVWSSASALGLLAGAMLLMISSFRGPKRGVLLLLFPPLAYRRGYDAIARIGATSFLLSGALLLVSIAAWIHTSGLLLAIDRIAQSETDPLGALQDAEARLRRPELTAVETAYVLPFFCETHDELAGSDLALPSKLEVLEAVDAHGFELPEIRFALGDCFRNVDSRRARTYLTALLETPSFSETARLLIATDAFWGGRFELARHHLEILYGGHCIRRTLLASAGETAKADAIACEEPDSQEYDELTGIARRAWGELEKGSRRTATSIEDLRKKVRIDDHPMAPLPEQHGFEIVRFEGPLGQLTAQLARGASERKNPALLFAHGGWECIGPEDVEVLDPFVKAGFVVMVPSWRGECDHPGHFEKYGGEIEDALAALTFLRAQPNVDPARVFMAGHSTGGTITMLVAESTDLLAAAYSIGGRADLTSLHEDYGPDVLTGDEAAVARSPIYHLAGLVTPLFYAEGAHAYIADVAIMEDIAQRRKLPFEAMFIESADHVTVVEPFVAVIVKKILAGTPTEITEAEVQAAFDD